MENYRKRVEMNNKTIGILKGKSNYQHIETIDLLCFGYQSKIYRDDAKAIEFDRESHLIPAPYNHKDLISRYDVRATLETAPCETHDHYMNRLDYLPPAEQEAEKLAEKERYYSLYTNEVEEELYKEELQKREKAAYNQISFSYDNIGPKQSPEQQEPEETDTTPFTPSVKLDLPIDIEVPSTLKLNQIIEKTAKFISSQGPQMEILLKTKQAANPQFNFLNHDGQYNSYYKHILGMMKSGTYPWQDTIDKSEENSQDSEEFKVNGHSETPPPPLATIVIPKITFKPSADCAYTQLISKITKAPIAEIEKQKLHENEMKNNGGNSNSAPDDVKKPSGLTGLVYYSSDSESEEEEEKAKYSGLLPPAELQVVIDKTAAYVAKNGVEFEETLRKKNDARFQFLDKSNEFFQYYLFKVNELNGYPQTPVIVVAQKPVSEVKIQKPPPGPVCFSIKPKEEKSQLKPTILQAGSDDEKPVKVPTPPRSANKINLTSVEEELEMQVDAMNAEREEKYAKERLSDKLMNAAREKLGMLPKEKMLQIERKKKALMFINQIKGSNGNSSNGTVNKEDEIINLTHYGDDSDDSVRSIPVTASPIVEKANVSRQSRSRKRSSSASYSSSRSRSRSSSRTRSHKRSKRKKSKSKSHRSKKKYRKRSRSRSRSYSKSHKKDRRDRRY